MLPSQTLVSSRGIPLCQQHSTKALYRSSSGPLGSLALPTALQRTNSGSVQSAGLVVPASLHASVDLPAEASQRITEHAQRMPSLLSTTLSPPKPRITQESDFKANFGTAVRYAWLLRPHCIRQPAR